jgi:hypothetical protein
MNVGGGPTRDQLTTNNSGEFVTLKKQKLIVIGILLAFCTGSFRGISAKDEDAMYFQIQSRVIQALIAREFEELKAKNEYMYFPHYLSYAFMDGWNPRPWDGSTKSYEFYGPLLASENNVTLKETDSGYRVYEMVSGNEINIFENKDWDTIHALVRDCNTLLEEKGRLACEFDGGYDGGTGYNDVLMPHTTVLFNVAYLKYQSQALTYRNGRYELIEGEESIHSLDMYYLLRRNAVVRMVYHRLSSIVYILFRIKEGEPFESLDQYLFMYRNWQEFAKNDLGVDVAWAETVFELTGLESNEKIVFPHDQDLIDEALKELNYYREKVNFSEHYMLTNYPMFLLSILRLYDVNLQIDEASGEVIIASGSTDPEAFFDIVAECTFVDDPSDTEYLKQHLNSWLEPDKPKQ